MRYRTETSEKVLNKRVIPLENIAPVLSIDEESRTKQSIESKLYDVFVRYIKK